LDITREDIAKGDIESCTHCPIGLAMQRAVGHSEIYVDRVNIADKRTGERSVVSRTKGGFISVGTPKELSEFQSMLMDGERVSPMRVTLNMELP
jgi:hypothetical protein